MIARDTGAQFITFEGPDGAGKSLQLALLSERLRADGRQVTLTREPGGTPVGEAVRSLLLAPDAGELLPQTEALLFCAARAEHVARVLRPALAEGRIVLCDRYADSTVAYQGHGRGVSLEWLDRVIAVATGGLVPDLTVLLDVPVEVGLARRRYEGGWNRIDAADLAFHRRVRDGFRQMAAREPARFAVVDASAPIAAVSEAIWDVVRDRRTAPSDDRSP